VPAEILAKYAGVYAGTVNGLPIRLEILPSGRELWFSRDGGAKQLLAALSNTQFVTPPGAQLEFIEEGGEIAALQFYAVGIDERLPRVREGK